MGNRSILLEDDATITDIDASGLRCFVKPYIHENPELFNFGESSLVYVLGQTSEMKKRNDDGTYSQFDKDLTLNVLGIVCIEKIGVTPQKISQLNRELQ